jgi:hypothetical protein
MLRSKQDFKFCPPRKAKFKCTLAVNKKIPITPFPLREYYYSFFYISHKDNENAHKMLNIPTYKLSFTIITFFYEIGGTESIDV